MDVFLLIFSFFFNLPNFGKNSKLVGFLKLPRWFACMKYWLSWLRIYPTTRTLKRERTTRKLLNSNCLYCVLAFRSFSSSIHINLSLFMIFQIVINVVKVICTFFLISFKIKIFTVLYLIPYSFFTLYQK